MQLRGDNNGSRGRSALRRLCRLVHDALVLGQRCAMSFVLARARPLGLPAFPRHGPAHELVPLYLLRRQSVVLALQRGHQVCAPTAAAAAARAACSFRDKGSPRPDEAPLRPRLIRRLALGARALRRASRRLLLHWRHKLPASAVEEPRGEAIGMYGWTVVLVLRPPEVEAVAALRAHGVCVQLCRNGQQPPHVLDRHEIGCAPPRLRNAARSRRCNRARTALSKHPTCKAEPRTARRRGGAQPDRPQ